MIRTIPNTPCLVQSGVVAYTPGSCCTSRDAAIIHSLLSSVGKLSNVLVMLVLFHVSDNNK